MSPVMTNVSPRPRGSVPCVTVVSRVLGKQLAKSQAISGSRTCAVTRAIVCSTAGLVHRRSASGGRCVRNVMGTIPVARWRRVSARRFAQSFLLRREFLEPPLRLVGAGGEGAGDDGLRFAQVFRGAVELGLCRGERGLGGGDFGGRLAGSGRGGGGGLSGGAQ